MRRPLAYTRRDDPEAYLLTWTGYGTWLPGDDRGSVDDEHNAFESPSAQPDPKRAEGARAAMRFAPTHLDNAKRAIVEATVRRHCEIKGWRLPALNVRTKHVHAVVDCGRTDPDVALEQLKAWCTRRLRESGLVSADHPVWTRRGSNRYLWDETSLAEGIDYVLNRQGEDLHDKP